MPARKVVITPIFPRKWTLLIKLLDSLIIRFGLFFEYGCTFEPLHLHVTAWHMVTVKIPMRRCPLQLIMPREDTDMDVCMYTHKCVRKIALESIWRN